MTYEPMKNLKEFHDKFHQLGKFRDLFILEAEDIDRRINLINEEFMEVDEALLALASEIKDNEGRLDYVPSMAHVAKELADLLYVVYGTAEELRIPIEDIFVKVHESNMSKIWDDGTVHYREDGKILKPPTYQPPDLSDIL